MTRNAACRKLSAVRDDYVAARFALAQMLRVYDHEQSVHDAAARSQITLGQLKTCAGNLHITYVVHLFATFESVLRDGWKRNTKPQMEVLINRIAARQKITLDVVKGAHEVRLMRNAIIHDRSEEMVLDFPSCLNRLGKFISWLPLTW